MAVAYLDIAKASELARRDQPDDELGNQLLDEMKMRKLAIDPEMTAFAMMCDRWDNLYYPQVFTKGGASHWADHESARLPGRAHVSLNVYPTYVDVPAALQSRVPVEQMMATSAEGSTQELAAVVERLYFAWKDEDDFEMKVHKACVTKGLYGRTAAKVYWDDEAGKPTVEIVDNPRNLYLGWRDSNYTKLEWAMYAYRITASTAMEDWGLRIRQETDGEGKTYPHVISPVIGELITVMPMEQMDLEVEVYDYWYRRPAVGAQLRFGKPTKFETWNAVFVGNVMVANQRHAEYKGNLPYVPLFNTYIPGLPEGRPEFYDIEQIIREKDERVSENAQMMSRAVNGQYWQLTGPEAPDQVPTTMKPVPNGVLAPGAGNRLESIDPWMPEFQFENFLTRLDRELVDASGLNDLLRGLAPSQVLDSGKAIQALVANYETRIMMKRGLLYSWRIDVWNLAALIWSVKNKKIREALSGKTRLVVVEPNLTPRDDAEAASISAQMKAAKIWSGKRSMDRMGVEDPEMEEDIIRDEQTDATLNPAEVQVMAQLIGILRSQGITPEPAVQNAVEAQAGALNDVRQLAPGPVGQEALNDPNAQPGTPPEQLPANAPGALTGPTVGAPTVGSEDLTLQTAIKGGEANSRILQQSRITTQAKG
jgi:hypothetical protein